MAQYITGSAWHSYASVGVVILDASGRYEAKEAEERKNKESHNDQRFDELKCDSRG